MKTLILAVASLSLFAACGGPLVPYPEELPHPQQTLTGAVVDDCAPFDGPALFFNLDGDAPACGLNFKKLSVSLWVAEPLVGTYALAGDYAHDGHASVCGAEECFQSKSGTFVIDAADAASVRGHYDFELANGEKRSGTFDVKRCAPSPRLCG